ncbi:MAG: SH3 domain-containing protein [Nitratireductor sp.]
MNQIMGNMIRFKKLNTILISGLLATTIQVEMSAYAQTGASGLPLPRYVSLKSNRTNMRVGPGRDYKVGWMYTRKGLPLEIYQEFDNWRKVRDLDGHEGWILSSLLSGERTAIVAPWKRDDKSALINLFQEPKDGARITARLEPGVLGEVDECANGWCKIEVKDYEGYVIQKEIWGVYPDESIK